MYLWGPLSIARVVVPRWAREAGLLHTDIVELQHVTVGPFQNVRASTVPAVHMDEGDASCRADHWLLGMVRDVLLCDQLWVDKSALSSDAKS